MPNADYRMPVAKQRPKSSEFAQQVKALRGALDSLAKRRVIFFGGKGGVGKTTLASLAAVHFTASRPVTLFSTDPASNLEDLFGNSAVPNLRIESIDAEALYSRFLDENLDAFLELADRGTYLDREEIRRFFELALPGIDELMSWLRIGELAAETDDLLIVDTAPTGHALRMLSSSDHFLGFERALESMQAKHRDLVEQLTRRRLHDAMDDFLERFRGRLDAYRSLLSDPARSAFVAVFLAERLVIDQTRRLIDEVRGNKLDVPFAILNRAPHDCDCDSCRAASNVKIELNAEFHRAPRSCVPLHSVERLRAYLAGEDIRSSGEKKTPEQSAQQILDLGTARMVFFAGKGGVGKTSSAVSTVLQLAARSPDERFTLISVDPAHSLRDIFTTQKPPGNLSLEMIDTRAKWKRLKERLGDEIRNAIDALTPKGVSIAHDSEVMEQLLDMGPPGADELFALMRLSDLLHDPEQKRVIVDTAPTGHFLRLLELPRTAGEWVREFMRLLLKYKEVIPPGSLAEQLIQASRSLNSFDAALRTEQCAAVVVVRPEKIVIEESKRLMKALEERGLRIAAVIANYLTPASSCSCDQSQRQEELQIVQALGEGRVEVPRHSSAPSSLEDLRSLIPLG